MGNDRIGGGARRGPGVSPGVFFVHSFQKEWTGKKIDKVLTLCRSLLPLMGTVQHPNAGTKKSALPKRWMLILFYQNNDRRIGILRAANTTTADARYAAAARSGTSSGAGAACQ